MQIKPFQRSIIAGWGFFMAGAVFFMKAGVQAANDLENQREAIQQEPVEPSGIDRGIDRDGGTGVRDICADSSEYRDDSRDGRTRPEYREGTQESSNLSRDSSGGNLNSEPGS